MARPIRKGLAYFPKDVDFYQDEKIVDLALKYGPLGLTVFDVLLTLVYREGYYLELPLSKVGQMIVRTVGESWFRKTGMSATDLSVEVILYCAEIGLINAPLVRQNVITSVAIQERYAAVTKRNKVNLTRYWLLDNRKVDGALESAPKKTVSVTETPVSVAETPKFSTVSTGTDTDDDTDGKAGFILSEYRRILPSLPPPVKTAKFMLNIFKVDRPLSDYTAVFERAAASRFLSEPKDGWQCNIGWLTDPANMDKVLAGKYDDYKARNRKENSQTIGDADSGFDTEEFFQAALRRGMKGMKNDGEPESQ